jgi:hypothetical protein
MSVVNVIVGTTRAAIVTDTVSYLDKEPIRLRRKAHAFREARFAISTRGACRIGDGFEALVEEAADFAEAVEWVVDAAPRMAEITRGDRRLIGAGFEVTLVGWTEDGPAASRITYRSKSDEVEVLTLQPGVYLAPSLGRLAMPADLDDGQIVRIAHAQQAIVVRNGMLMCVGGDVELTEITAEAVTQRALAPYPDKAMTLARIAAGDAGRVGLAAA